jgi:hypothetical protein
MKRSIVGAMAVASVVWAGSAFACPTGEGVRGPIVRPVGTDASSRASALVERAASLESTAASFEASARVFDRHADTLAARLRDLRNRAAIVPVGDRARVFAAASELAALVRNSREHAASERAEAADLRAEARALRSRARDLVKVGDGRGNGWRRRPLPLPMPRTPTPNRDTGADQAI